MKKKKTTAIGIALIAAVCFCMTGLADRYCYCKEECCAFSMKFAQNEVKADPLPACCLSKSPNISECPGESDKASDERHSKKEPDCSRCLGCDTSNRHQKTAVSATHDKPGGTSHLTVALSENPVKTSLENALGIAYRLRPMPRSSPIYLEVLSIRC